MISEAIDRPILRSRIVRDITLILENEYKTYIKSRGKVRFKQTDSENEQELMYALLIAHLDGYIKSNDYTLCALLYIYFLKNPNTIYNFFTYYEPNVSTLEGYVIIFVNELSYFAN